MALTRKPSKWIFWTLVPVCFFAFAHSGLLLALEVESVRLYQQVGSPIMRHFVTCRFQPSCSNYALQVLEREGLGRGNWLVAKRLLHCSPLGLLW
ncbi:MAG: membrane protein insertion efficiency factor YidD [Acidobacteriota bacterium]